MCSADIGTQHFNFKNKFDMKNETLTNHELGNYANLLLPAVFTSDVKPELNRESDRKISYPVMILLNSKGSEYLNDSDVVDGFFDYENNHWYILFDGNGYTGTKHDETILGWRYLTCIENTKRLCAYRL